MRPSQALSEHRAAIRRAVSRHRALNPRVFGSVVHGADTDASDLDILVDLTPETSLFDLGALQFELSELLGVSVDIISPARFPKACVLEFW